MTLNFNLKVKFYRVFDMYLCPAHNFLGVWHWLTIIGTWVYHHEMICRVYSWSRYYLDLWPQGQIYRLVSCLHVRPVTSVYFDIGLWPWPLTSISKLYFHHVFESSKMSLVFDRGISNVGIWVYHHETTCCVPSWP